MILYMIMEIEKHTFSKEVYPVCRVLLDRIANIQTAEAERDIYLEDHPGVSPDNVQVIQYRE